MISSETSAPPPGTGNRFEINSPFARESIDRLLSAATSHEPQTNIDRAHQAAETLELGDRVAFELSSSADDAE